MKNLILLLSILLLCGVVSAQYPRFDCTVLGYGSQSLSGGCTSPVPVYPSLPKDYTKYGNWPWNCTTECDANFYQYGNYSVPAHGQCEKPFSTSPTFDCQPQIGTALNPYENPQSNGDCCLTSDGTCHTSLGLPYCTAFSYYGNVAYQNCTETCNSTTCSYTLGNILNWRTALCSGRYCRYDCCG